MIRNSQIVTNTNEALELTIIDTLLKGENVKIPDVGYLEVKTLLDRRTVLFRMNEEEESFLRTMSVTSEKGKKEANIFQAAISSPLKEGKVISLPKVGVFRPTKREDGKVHVSFVPSSALRKLLNGEKEILDIDKDRREIPKDRVRVDRVAEEVLIAGAKTPVNETKAVNETKVVSETKIVDVTVSEKEKGEDRAIETEDVGGNEPAITTKTKSGSRASHKTRREDVIVPAEETGGKMKSKSISGWVLGTVAAVVVVAAVLYAVVSRSGKREDERRPNVSSSVGSLNLPALAEKHYGNPAFWVYIYQANQDKLNSPINIPSNVSLVFPDLQEEYDVDITDSMEVKRANILSEFILGK